MQNIYQKITAIDTKSVILSSERNRNRNRRDAELRFLTGYNFCCVTYYPQLFCLTWKKYMIRLGCVERSAWGVWFLGEMCLGVS